MLTDPPIVDATGVVPRWASFKSVRNVKVFYICTCGDDSQGHVMSVSRLIGSMSEDVIDAKTLQWIHDEGQDKQIIRIEIEKADGAAADAELERALTAGESRPLRPCYS